MVQKWKANLETIVPILWAVTNVSVDAADAKSCTPPQNCFLFWAVEKYALQVTAFYSRHKSGTVIWHVDGALRTKSSLNLC